MTAPPPSSPAVGGTRHDWVEIVATVVLALAAVATAWSSYQATRWNGETTKATGRVNALRIDAARAQGLAEGQTQVDIGMYFQWVNADASGDAELADFYADRFRPEFRPAFDAWLAAEPLTAADAPPTPFAMEEYALEAAADAQRLDAEAEAMSATVRRNVQRAANYVLGVVLFAVALFFAGMSTKLRTPGPRKVLVAVGCVVFIGTAIWIATFPINVAV
jgi:ferric-dicitrate binding protein FerR (iron transport regulator)